MVEDTILFVDNGFFKLVKDDFENEKVYKFGDIFSSNMFPVIFRGHWMTFFGGAF